MSEVRLTKDSNSHAADSDLSADFMGDGALIGATVLRGGLWDTEGVDDPVRKTLLPLNSIQSLEACKNKF